MNCPQPTRDELAAMIDHAILRPDATLADLAAACDLARRVRVACLCVRGSDVSEVSRRLLGTGVLIGTVIGFPHGCSSTAGKVSEAHRAVQDGAEELDMVLNISRLRSGQVAYVQDGIAAVVTAAQGKCVKVILECCYLTTDQKVAASRAAIAAGANFVKTSTGFGPGGATVEDVKFLRAQVGDRAGVKAAGGIRTLADALSMIAAGANRIGTSSTETILAELPV